MSLLGATNRNRKQRIGIATGSFFVCALIFSGTPGQVSALSLDLNLSLPLGQVLQPVTNLLNPVTQSLPVAPITVSPTNGPVGVTLTTPSTTPSTSPSPTPTTTPSKSAAPTTKNTPSNVSSNSDSTTRKDEPKSPVDTVASFFTNTLPGTASNVANFIAGKRVDPLPIIISSVIFSLTLLVIAMIIYASHHAGPGRFGRFSPARQIVETHDLTQMITLIIVTISFGFVAIYLSLTIL